MYIGKVMMYGIGIGMKVCILGFCGSGRGFE